jgi:hypothetical protein
MSSSMRGGGRIAVEPAGVGDLLNVGIPVMADRHSI